MTDEPSGLTLLSESQAAERLGFTPRFLQARRYRGNGPKYVRISARAIRYRLSDLEEWVAERVKTSTSSE
ncbi:helix-turn-helix transcriptional regulator [Gemmatimonadota bacterium]